jgi:hypothetical protein
MSQHRLCGGGLHPAHRRSQIVHQRTRHEAVTRRLLQHGTRKDLEDGYLFSIDRAQMSVAELAEWVADESRCCPAVDFHVELPAFGPLTLRLDGGADVKAFIAAELGL